MVEVGVVPPFPFFGNGFDNELEVEEVEEVEDLVSDLDVDGSMLL